MKGLVLISLIVGFLCAVAPAAGERCGRNYDGRKCSDFLCCSHFDWCDKWEAHCSKQRGCQSYCWTSDGGAENVTARYAFYNTEEINWNMTAAHVACSSNDANKPLQWRSKFPWAAFCGPVGPQGRAACGKCVRLLHTRKNQGMDVYATVRVVDACGDGALVLDSTVFNQLDFDGEGYHKGHLQVSYRFIDCEDDNNGLLSIV